MLQGSGELQQSVPDPERADLWSTSEKFHHTDDTDGKLLGAAFAQTPQGGQSGYSNTCNAGTRARAFYEYDPAGRIKNLEHDWDTWGGASYSSTPILGLSYTYEMSRLNRGLRTLAEFYEESSGNWALHAKQQYAYNADAALDVRALSCMLSRSTISTWSSRITGNK